MSGPTTPYDHQGNPTIHSREYKRLRERILRKDPLCQRCKEEGLTKAAEEIHHVKPRRTHPHLVAVESNCRQLCKECHLREEDEAAGIIRKQFCHHGLRIDDNATEWRCPECLPKD